MKQQHVVVLTFDNNGILKSISQRDLAQGVQVAMDKNQTPVPGGHAGFIQQLVGGVGSYNPLGASTAGAGGAGAGAGGLGGNGGFGATNNENIGGTGGGGGF